jgi:NAD(P)-dependent dehydrogenase (short-subunit alcohol dehydrogenase family)
MKEGYRVVIAARRVERLRDMVHNWGDDLEHAMALEMDVTSETSVIAGFDKAEERFGPIDVVIANAGISIAGSAMDLRAEDFDHILGVNVRGVFLSAREGARRMAAAARPDRHKRIILVASIGGLKALQGLTAYSCSKAAVVMLGQGLAREWVDLGINVNVVCPGFIQTELNEAWFKSSRGKRQVESFARRRLMQAVHLDQMISFLAGPDSEGVTGSVFKLDDGQTL